MATPKTAHPVAIKKLSSIITNTLRMDEETMRIMISNATGGRTSSRKDMYAYEINALIEKLQPTKKQAATPTDPANKMRRKILSMCHEVGVTYYSKPAQKNVIDFKRLNAWIAKYGHAKHATLNDYTVEELPTLVTQFEKVYKHYFKTV